MNETKIQFMQWINKSYQQKIKFQFKHSIELRILVKFCTKIVNFFIFRKQEVTKKENHPQSKIL